MWLKKIHFSSHKLRWRLIIIFILLVLAVMVTAGTILLNNIRSIYREQFKDTMNSEFGGGMANTLTMALSEENPDLGILKVMETYSLNRLGINANRNYYILKGDTSECIGSSLEIVDELDITENIITAMSGSVGDKIYPQADYMDYAYPVKGKDSVKYIVYIKDNKEDVSSVTEKMVGVISQSVLYGAIFAIIIGILLSNTITRPIRNLTL